MFDQLVVSTARLSRTNKPWTVMLSAMGQSALLGMLILVPLIYTEALPNAMLKTLIVAPPAPSAPASPMLVRTTTRVRVMPLSHILTPRSIPMRISTGEIGPPVVYVEGGSAIASDGKGLSDLLQPAGPIAPRTVEQKPRRIPVGGLVEAALLVNRVVPAYPAPARAAHVSGTVVLHAIIAKDGTVQELTYVSGPPLLLKAAMDAVHQWRYRPTLLNGEPVEVSKRPSMWCSPWPPNDAQERRSWKFYGQASQTDETLT